MNNLPIMPIRAKYADETAEGKNIDSKITEFENKIAELEDNTQKINYNEGDSITEIAGAVEVGTLSADIISAPEGTFEELNGESDPSVKPIYYHPITIWGKDGTSAAGDSMSLVALTNSATAFTMTSFIAWLKANNITYLAPASGSVYHNSERYIIAWVDIRYTDGEVSNIYIRGHGLQTGQVYLEQIDIPIASFIENYNFGDGVNKVN